MNPAKNLLLVLLVVLAAGLGLLAWKARNELGDLRLAEARAADEKSALQKEKSTLEKTAGEAQQRVKELEGDLAALRSRPAPADNSAAPTGGAPSAARSLSDMAATAMGMLDNPEMQRLMAIQQKVALNGRYAALFKNLHLDPARLSQFKDLLVEKQMVNTDVLMAATKQGINPLQDPKGFRELMLSTQADIDSKIKTTLGDDGFAQFQNYQQTQGQRTVVNQLEQSLSYTDAPLTSSQSEQMVEILSQTAVTRGSAAGNTGRTSSAITDETIARAKGVLSPAQLQALQEIQQQQQASQQAARIMIQNQAGRAAGPSAVRPPAPGG